MGGHFQDYVSFGGVATVALGSLCYWMSGRSGKKAQELEAVPRLQGLAELRTLLKAKEIGEGLVASVSGRVCSDKPLKCENVPDQGVIHRSITREVFMKKNDKGEWKRDNSTITDFTRETQWHLGDSSSVKLDVRDGKSASGLKLKSVFVGFESDGNDAVDSVANLIKVGADLWNGVKKIGTEKTEGILPLGTTVTCVGEVSKTSNAASSSSFVVQRPMKGPFYITTQSLPELVHSLSLTSKRWWFLGIGFTCVGSYFIVKKLYTKILQDWRMKQFRREILRKREEDPSVRPSEGGDEVDVDKVCIVCMEAKYDTVFINCGHMCCCANCAAKVKRCPICRQVSKYKRVYQA